MLSRRKSILHLGEGEERYTGDDEDLSAKIAGAGGSIETLKMIRSAEGLRIVIQKVERGSNVVIKSSLKPSRSRTKNLQLSNIVHVDQYLGFLKTCFSCKNDLCPQEDVFMYRGDQGFCSEECRCRQILLDERRELDLVRLRRRATGTASGAKVDASDSRQRRVLVAS